MNEKMEQTRQDYFNARMMKSSRDYPGTIGLKLEAIAWYQYALYGHADETYDADKWTRIVLSIVRKVKKSDSDYASAATIDAALTVIQRAQDSRYCRKAYGKIGKAIALMAMNRQDEIPEGIVATLYSIAYKTSEDSPEGEILAREEVRDMMLDAYGTLSDRTRARLAHIAETMGPVKGSKYILETDARRASFKMLCRRAGLKFPHASLDDIAYCFMKYIV